MKLVSLVPASSTMVLVRGSGAFVRPDGRRRIIARLAKTLVAGGFLVGSSALAQYPPSTPSYASPFGAPPSPIYMQPASEAANQSDEQLLTIGRLLEQQGRYTQAQRIYTELERRRLAGIQHPAPPPSTYSAAQPPIAAYQPQPPAAAYQPQTTSLPQQVSPPVAWQAPPMQMASPQPVMQPAPQMNMPFYEPRPQMMAPPVQPSATMPPPAPPSEAYVVDREVTPAPKTTTEQPSEGWRSALAPLPAALRAWSVDIPTPYQQQVRTSAAPAGGAATNDRATTDASALPDLPIGPVAPLGSIGTQFPPKAPAAEAGSPPRFVPPAIASGEGQSPSRLDAVPPTPPAMRLRPMSEKRLDTFEPDRDTAQELTSQTDSIRIIPGQPSSLQLKPEPNSKPIELSDPAADRPRLAKTPPQWTPNPVAATTPDQPRMPVRPMQAPEENPPRFNLAALLTTPEFREIHTETVLQGLELLASPEARLRMMGAARISSAGPDGRTALPVLRKILISEPEKKVVVRVAETVLKLQPNDRAATACLSELLSDRNDAELRENVVTALGSAAGGKNPVALARLTDALDDPNSRVRAAAAANLALFGPAAVESASRLEGAAVNDVPSVQRAAAMALAAIRGSEAEGTIGASPNPRLTPFDLQTPASRPWSPLPAGSSMGRVKLNDQPVTEGTVEGAIPESRAASAPPKLLPADRIANSHSLMTSPEMADEATPADATDAAQKRTPAPAPVNGELPLELQPTTPPRAPATSGVSTSPTTFLLQSETGESKAGASP